MIVVAPRFLRFISWIFGIKMEIGGLAILPFIFVPDDICKNNIYLKRMVFVEKVFVTKLF